MGANTGKRAIPRWRTLYEAAVLELDLDKLPQRISEAERAIMDRMDDLNSSDSSESLALMNALNIVRDLRKMAQSAGHPTQQ